MSFSGWSPQPKQQEFLSCKAREAFFGGAAGGGKSEAALVLAIIRCLKYNNTTSLVLRRTLPELEGGHGLIARSKEFLHGAARWSERKKKWTFHNGSVLEFGYCERDDDVQRYEGSEYATICVDEVTHVSQYIWDNLRSRNRVPYVKGNEKCMPVMRATGMPKGPGVAWVRRTFVDPCPEGGEWEVDLGKAGSITRAFIPSKLDDNKYLCETDEYRQNLLLLPEHLRNALLDGRWDVYEGAYFSMFDPKRHVVERKVEQGWSRICAIDYGYSAPMCALWGAVDDRGRVYIYREIYKAGLRDEEQARIISAFNREDKVTIVKADPSCWNKRGESGRSTAEVWGEFGLYAVKADNNRVQGWSRVRSMLEIDVGDYPALTISPDCTNLIRTLPDMAIDDGNPEDIDTRQEDHAVDTVRYLLSDFRVPQRTEKMSPIPFDIRRYVGLTSKRTVNMSDSVRERRVMR